MPCARSFRRTHAIFVISPSRTDKPGSVVLGLVAARQFRSPLVFLAARFSVCRSSFPKNTSSFLGIFSSILDKCPVHVVFVAHMQYLLYLRVEPISRVLSCTVIYLGLPSPISSSVIHGCIRAGNPFEYSPNLHRTGFTWHGTLPPRR